jgi:hypothetical protein
MEFRRCFAPIRIKVCIRDGHRFVSSNESFVKTTLKKSKLFLGGEASLYACFPCLLYDVGEILHNMSAHISVQDLRFS